MIMTMVYSVALSLLYNKHNGNEIKEKQNNSL
jgi:hypothetical protein